MHLVATSPGIQRAEMSKIRDFSYEFVDGFVILKRSLSLIMS